MTSKFWTALAAGAALAAPGIAFAQEAAVDMTPPNGEIGYIFNTFMFLIAGFLVMWMAAGFTMLEAGLVRQKNVTMQLMKNVSLFSLAGVMYYLIGYNLMYPGDGWT
ncbi:MAG: ammonium transporter, partial [Tranquillimonas sp.]